MKSCFSNKYLIARNNIQAHEPVEAENSFVKCL